MDDGQEISATPRAPRLTSIDALRGLVMVIMALDHTRDLFSNATFDPTDLTQTTPLLFFTRWITHFCAPVFVLLAGTSAFLSLSAGKSRGELARFLLTRGLWLMLLEVAVVTPLGWSFNFDYGFTRLQVIWVIGAAMVVLAALVPLAPRRAIGVLGLVIVLGHNVFDGPHVAWLGGFAGAWKLLHNLTPLQPFPHKTVLSIYPIAPWFGVMALGYGCVGELMLVDPRRRDRLLLIIGLSMIAAFVVLRASNLYGDPKPWAIQKDAVRTVLSFVNGAKYPPSLLYLLMTLGPAAIALAFADRLPRLITGVLTTYGRTPLFYYLLHLPILHGLAVLFSYVRYGQAPWLFHDMMAQKGAAHPIPPGYGYDLWVVYLVWIAVVAALYPACRWYARVKRRNKHPLLSYL